MRHGYPSQVLQRMRGWSANPSVQTHTERSVKRVQSGGCEICAQPLQPLFMRNGWIRIGRARRIGRIHASFPAHLEEILGLSIIRREVLVGERPCGRNSAMVADLTKIGFAQPK